MFELDRWHRQLRGVLRRPPGTQEVAVELMAALGRLRSAQGPELFRLNDRCNELIRKLPVRHSTRLWAERQGDVLPQRPHYLYFGACASLPYVREAARLLESKEEVIEEPLVRPRKAQRDRKRGSKPQNMQEIHENPRK